MRKIDVVYVLGAGSRWQNNELRYSLRSVQKHLRHFRNIYIIGIKPSFVQNVIHLPARDVRPGDLRCKEQNIMNKILIACAHPDISDDFLFINDDHFLLTRTEAPNYPFYHNGDLSNAISRRRIEDGYQQSQKNTLRLLRERKCFTDKYDIHCPIIYNKHTFPRIMQSVDWSIPYGYVIKSLYANLAIKPGKFMNDCWINYCLNQQEIAARILGRSVFTITDGALNNAMKHFLQAKYPVPSRYEKH